MAPGQRPDPEAHLGLMPGFGRKVRRLELHAILDGQPHRRASDRNIPVDGSFDGVTVVSTCVT